MWRLVEAQDTHLLGLGVPLDDRAVLGEYAVWRGREGAGQQRVVQQPDVLGLAVLVGRLDRELPARAEFLADLLAERPQIAHEVERLEDVVKHSKLVPEFRDPLLSSD